MSRVFRSRKRPLPPIQLADREMGRAGLLAPEAIIEKAREEAGRTLEEARREADRILGEAREAAEGLSSEAKSEGFDKGYKTGMEDALAKAQSFLDQAVETLSEAKSAFSNMRTEAEPMLVAIAVDVAKRIVGEALACDPELVLSMVREGMAALDGEAEYVVRVKPAVKDLLDGWKENLRQESGAKRIEICADETLGDGCLIRTPHGFVDARVDTQISNLAQALGEARRNLVEDKAP